MCLLGALVCRFHLIASSPTCSLSQLSASSTPLTGTRSPHPASPLDGVECLAVLPIRLQTGFELKLCVDASDEHTPINLPDSSRIFPHDCNATIAVTSEEPDVLRHSGTSSSSKQSFHCVRFIGKLALETVGNSIQETGAELERETVVSTLFISEPKGKRDRHQNFLQSSRDTDNLHIILERKAEMAAQGERMAQQKLYEAEAEVDARYWEKVKF